jgi:hypothetical protein
MKQWALALLLALVGAVIADVIDDASVYVSPIVSEGSSARLWNLAHGFLSGSMR